jgi:hypothetical protein
LRVGENVGGRRRAGMGGRRVERHVGDRSERRGGSIDMRWGRSGNEVGVEGEGWVKVGLVLVEERLVGKEGVVVLRVDSVARTEQVLVAGGRVVILDELDSDGTVCLSPSLDPPFQRSHIRVAFEQHPLNHLQLLASPRQIIPSSSFA